MLSSAAAVPVLPVVPDSPATLLPENRSSVRGAPVDYGELRLADLHTFVTIVRAGSLSGAARSLAVTPSQASKAIARLERQLHARLLTRGARGVHVTRDGERLLPRATDLLARARSLYVPGQPSEPELTVVGAAWLTSLLVPRIALAQTGYHIRSLDVPPGVASASATGHAFDVALTTGTERWPDSWSKVEVGTIRRALFASPATAERLGHRAGGAAVPVSRVRQLPFISPVYGNQGQVVIGDDGCPLGHGERRVGHETQTLALALELAASTGQLVFAPVLAARALVDAGRLVEVPVEGWDVRETLVLVCEAQHVRARVQRQLVAALVEALGAAPAPAARELNGSGRAAARPAAL